MPNPSAPNTAVVVSVVTSESGGGVQCIASSLGVAVLRRRKRVRCGAACGAEQGKSQILTSCERSRCQHQKIDGIVGAVPCRAVAPTADSSRTVVGRGKWGECVCEGPRAAAEGSASHRAWAWQCCDDASACGAVRRAVRSWANRKYSQTAHGRGVIINESTELWVPCRAGPSHRRPIVAVPWLGGGSGANVCVCEGPRAAAECSASHRAWARQCCDDASACGAVRRAVRSRANRKYSHTANGRGVIINESTELWVPCRAGPSHRRPIVAVPWLGGGSGANVCVCEGPRAAAECSASHRAWA